MFVFETAWTGCRWFVCWIAMWCSACKYPPPPTKSAKVFEVETLSLDFTLVCTEIESPGCLPKSNDVSGSELLALESTRQNKTDLRALYGGLIFLAYQAQRVK